MPQMQYATEAGLNLWLEARGYTRIDDEPSGNAVWDLTYERTVLVTVTAGAEGDARLRLLDRNGVEFWEVMVSPGAPGELWEALLEKAEELADNE
jgi:hypothetical protein